MSKSKTDATTSDPKAAKAAAPPTPCLCGCGAATGKRSAWRQGHDARAKGWMQRAAAGRLIEGERALVVALLARTDPRGALKTEAMTPLAEAAKAALAQGATKAA